MSIAEVYCMIIELFNDLLQINDNIPVSDFCSDLFFFFYKVSRATYEYRFSVQFLPTVVGYALGRWLSL